MSNWKETYQSKITSLEVAASQVQSGDVCYVAPCSGAPIELVQALCDRYKEIENVTIISALLLYPFDFIMDSDFIGHIDYITAFYGPFERAFFDEGNVNIANVNLSQVAEAGEDVYRIRGVSMVDVSPPDEDGYMNYGPMGVALNQEMIDVSRTVIVQVNKFQPRVSGVKNRIHVDDVHFIVECDHELPELPQPEVSDVDNQIAKQILPYIEDGSTIQLGIGGLSNAIGYSLEGKKNLSVYTEMFTDSMVHLAKMGVITGTMKTAFGLGSQELYEFCGQGRVEFAPISQINNPREIAKNDKLISVASCLMADLTGQICSEGIGHYSHSSTGGQLDFAIGSPMNRGNKAFMCLPSTITKPDGSVISTINLNLPLGAVVTTPRALVQNVVTEYGIANIFLSTIRQRVVKMIAIAHPDFRAGLYKDALEAGLIREIDMPK